MVFFSVRQNMIYCFYIFDLVFTHILGILLFSNAVFIFVFIVLNCMGELWVVEFTAFHNCAEALPF